MQLKRLSSNMNSFHSIDFKEGLNLIVGKQANPDDSNKKNTYNGVGKSLIIYLIHFCLGSNRIAVFEEKIPGWEFRLEFLIEGELYTSIRNTSKQSKVFLNGEQLTLSKFRFIMLDKVFGVQEKINNLTFNTLFPRFIRRDRECYVRYDTFVRKEQDYSRVLNNTFLLGIETDLVTKKQGLRSLYNETNSLKSSIENDPIIKSHFNNNEDTDIEVLDLEDNIMRLESEITAFKIASNYHDIENEADQKKYELKNLENKRVLINNSIRNINKSLEIEPDVSEKKVINLYKQAKVEVPEMVVKKIEEVVKFQYSLLKNRKKRLSKELIKNREKAKEVEVEMEKKGIELNKLLEYLDSHGALDDYTALNKKLSDLKIKLEKLKEYQEILKTYKKKLRDVQSELSDQNNQTEEYLEANQELLEEIMTTFRNLSKSFYDKPGGIKIVNNEGENTLRFNIVAKIQDDSSDGVNEVKIFCFDMTLLLLQQNHNVKFLFHDSRLFANMDPRQRYTLFKLAHKEVFNNGLQYIATINEDTLHSFKDQMDPDEYKEIIEDNIILKLTDESDESKLLGIQVDMDYEK